MPKTSTLRNTLILLWIQLLISCTPCQAQDSLKYTILRWQAVRLIEDAYKKRIQDTVIERLDSLVAEYESDKIRVYTGFNSQIKAMNEIQAKQSEIITYQESLTSYYKLESRKYKTQRDIGITAVIAYTVVRIGIKVFKPP